MVRKEVPPGWQRRTLGDVATIVMGQSPPGATVTAWDAGLGGDGPGLPFIQGNAEFTSKIPVPRRWCSSPAKFAEPGDTLISVRAPVGALNLASMRLAIGRGLAALRFIAVHPRFGWHLMRVAVDDLTRLGQGSTFEAINSGNLGNLTIFVPPPDEQVGIANFLDAIDEAIEKTGAVIHATERLRQALLKELLTRGVPGWHDRRKHVADIGEIPARWNAVRLRDAAQVQTGRAIGKAPVAAAVVVLPYLTVANVKDGYVDLTAVKTMGVAEQEIERFSLKSGDVLFTEGGDADKLGRGCVWRGEIAPCLHQNHVFAVRPLADVLRPDFLAAYARSPRGKAYFLSCAKQTTNLASINSTQLKEFPLPLPSLAEQDEILGVLLSIPDSLANMDALRTVKVAVADALLSGRARAPAVDRTMLARSQ